MLQAEASMCKEARAAAAGPVVGGLAGPRLLFALSADDVAVAAAFQVVPELGVVTRGACTAHCGGVPAARLLHEGAWGALVAHQPFLSLRIPPWVGERRACRLRRGSCVCHQSQQQGGQRPRWGQGRWAPPFRCPHGPHWGSGSASTVPGSRDTRTTHPGTGSTTLAATTPHSDLGCGAGLYGPALPRPWGRAHDLQGTML